MNSLPEHLAQTRWRRYEPMIDRYWGAIEVVQLATKKMVTAGDFVRSLGGHDARELLRQRILASDGETWTEKCAHADFTTYLPDDICVKVDIASMAYGLETRAPLLDHVLIEKVAQLPFRLKMQGITGKHVLRRALRNRLPATTLTRKKMGFGVPIEVWFKGGFSKLLEDVLLDQKARERGILDPAGVRGLIDQHKAHGGQQYPLFALLMLEIWFRKWIDVAKPIAEPVMAGSLANHP
jgi:asparagine synthase (glutamine-hydrolysing)